MTALLRFGVKCSRVEAEAIDAAAEILLRAEVPFAIARGGKHLAIECCGYKITISNSPRTDNHKTWARQGVRKLLRKLELAA